MPTFTPREIVSELDRYIVGQHAAKRAVAIALRNRWRRLHVPDALRDEIAPKNIIMIGPTGVGKTEISRRLAKLGQAPFVKVEASKFTEVGYVGRDVDSIIRDLTELAINMVREEEKEKVRVRAREQAEERVLGLLLPRVRPERRIHAVGGESERKAATPEDSATREKLRRMLREGKLDERLVELEVTKPVSSMIEVMTPQGMEEIETNLKEMLQNLLPKKSKKTRMRVPEALETLAQEEATRLIDMEAATKEAIRRVEQSGIVFIDEIDKIAGREGMHGPDVSREGVQRDLLPIVEGSTVNTKHGPVRTDHVLFIASGACHVAKPSDLIPEFQGRFPIRVELDALTQADFIRILTEPENALIRQYTALLATEHVALVFRDDAIAELARIAALVNERTENIGARRLHTVMERLLDEISFDAPEMDGRGTGRGGRPLEDALGREAGDPACARERARPARRAREGPAAGRDDGGTAAGRPCQGRRGRARGCCGWRDPQSEAPARAAEAVDYDVVGRPRRDRRRDPRGAEQAARIGAGVVVALDLGPGRAARRAQVEDAVVGRPAPAGLDRRRAGERGRPLEDLLRRGARAPAGAGQGARAAGGGGERPAAGGDDGRVVARRARHGRAARRARRGRGGRGGDRGRRGRGGGGRGRRWGWRRGRGARRRGAGRRGTEGGTHHVPVGVRAQGQAP